VRSSPGKNKRRERTDWHTQGMSPAPAVSMTAAAKNGRLRANVSDPFGFERRAIEEVDDQLDLGQKAA
jgi:hypothetical protein